jgi:ribonuclease HI
VANDVQVIAYTDGGCRGNPGVGAWATVLINPRKGTCLELAGGERQTTNNRMEMTAAIEALKALKAEGLTVLVRSDSKYLIQCCQDWMPGWKRNGWKKKDGPLKNVDLLQELDRLLARHRVRWEWVAGHSGERGNERCDQLANEAMDRLGRGEEAAWERRGTW